MYDDLTGRVAVPGCKEEQRSRRRKEKAGSGGAVCIAGASSIGW